MSLEVARRSMTRRVVLRRSLLRGNAGPPPRKCYKCELPTPNSHFLLLKSAIEVVQPLAESKKNEKECSSAATLAATLEA